MNILRYSFDGKSQSLEYLSDVIVKDYGILGYRECSSNGVSTQLSSQVANILSMRRRSPNVQKGYILGVVESLDIVGKCGDTLKMVLIDAFPEYSITLWVNEFNVIRAYIFLNEPMIAKDRGSRY